MKKMTFYLLLLIANTSHADLLGLSNPADMAGKQGLGVYSSVNYLMATDYTSARHFNGNWSGSYSPRSGTNLAMGAVRIELGATYDSWRLASIYRLEEFIEASRDTVDMIYDNKQHLTVPAGKTFNTSLRVQGFEVKGLRLDKGFNMAIHDEIGLSLGIGISLLQGRRARFSDVSGTATSTATGYTYNALLNDSNSRATYPFIVPGTPEGAGYALDVGAKIAWAQGAHLDLAINDLLGQITWRNMPNTLETANSATLARDPSGYIYYNPVLSGVNAINRQTVVQKLGAKAHGRFTYPIDNFEVFLGSNWIMGYWLPELGTGYRINEHWKAAVDYDTRFKTIGLGIQHQYGRLSVRSSNATQNYGLNGEIHFPFE
ncbi:MAG: hypothetical protein WAO71_06005 [Gallionella sp.]